MNPRKLEHGFRRFGARILASTIKLAGFQGFGAIGVYRSSFGA